MKWVLLLMVLALMAGLILYRQYAPFPSSKARPAEGDRHEFEREGRKVLYYTRGRGPRVLLSASAGREVSDFNELTRALVSAGFRTVAVEAPGIGDSTLPKQPMTLYDLADDVLAADEREAESRGGVAAAVLGHAFGNRVARAFASRYPQRVRSVILLAAGGKRPPPAEASRSLRRSFDPRIKATERVNDVRYAFFAPGNPVPLHWLKGWHRYTAELQGAATAAVDSEEWWSAGPSAPILVVQASDDRIAPKEDTADLLLAEFPDRVRVVVIPNTGHALLPERPGEIAEAVIDFLQQQSAAGLFD